VGGFYRENELGKRKEKGEGEREGKRDATRPELSRNEQGKEERRERNRKLVLIEAYRMSRSAGTHSLQD